MRLQTIRSVALLSVVFLFQWAEATWSIALADVVTGEVGVASITCVANLDLRSVLPVVVPGVGAGVCQASGDFDGARRPVMRGGILKSMDPDDIIDVLASISGHQSRQYGLVNTTGAASTFSGVQTSGYSGGFSGQIGNLAYAVQGNILAGACVLDPILDVLNDTAVVGMPSKLMRSLRVATDMGGDGRCSCSRSRPTSCGCPVANFRKGGDVGFAIVALPMDADSDICGASGCAEGNYYFNINAIGGTKDPDPMDMLEEMFIEWSNQRTAVILANERSR